MIRHMLTPTWQVNGNTLHFPTIKVKNANIKQFNLNKIISWVGLRVLAQRNTIKLPTQKAWLQIEMVNDKGYDNLYAWKSIRDNSIMEFVRFSLFQGFVCVFVLCNTLNHIKLPILGLSKKSTKWQRQMNQANIKQLDSMQQSKQKRQNSAGL